jgi:hypothetical protein
MAADVEKAAGQRNMREVYDITKKNLGKYKQADLPIRDKNGQTISRIGGTA